MLEFSVVNSVGKELLKKIAAVSADKRMCGRSKELQGTGVQIVTKELGTS